MPLVIWDLRILIRIYGFGDLEQDGFNGNQDDEFVGRGKRKASVKTCPMCDYKNIFSFHVSVLSS